MRTQELISSKLQIPKINNYQEYKYYDPAINDILNIAKDEEYIINFYLIDTKEYYGCCIQVMLNKTHNGTDDTIIQYRKDITKFKRHTDNIIERINNLHDIDYEYSYPSWLTIDMIHERKEVLVIDTHPLWGRS